MNARLIYFLKYYLFWVVFFLVQKPLFMIWHHDMLGTVRIWDWLLVPLHGLWLDFSVAAYMTAVIGLVLCVSVWVQWDKIRLIPDIYTDILLVVALWTMLGDNGCFPSWGYHLNKDLFDYFASPQEVLACAPWWAWLLGLLASVGLFFMWRRFYRYVFFYDGQRIHSVNLRQSSWKERIMRTTSMLLLTGLLFLPMRGSVTVSTMNTGRVYYSTNRMLNLAAVNPLFNIIETLSEDHFSPDRYHYMSSAEAEDMTDRLFHRGEQPMVLDTLLTTQRPNIVLVILESFSKNAMDAGAMPHLRHMADKGLFFPNTYAASHRTDRGVMAVLGAFPGCATSSLMMVPSKSAGLPQIGQVLQQEGYRLKFYYGGDEDFTNMRSYLITGGFENRVADRDFPISDKLSKWGVPDHIVFNRAAKEISQHTLDAPYFDVILTLSSHEPFEVPYHHFDNEYLNAIGYTDSCLGVFIDSLRLSPTWDNTLVVMVADHGYPYPASLQSHEPLHHKIPLVMIGGAIRSPRVVTTCCQQVDWVPTVLHQMGIGASQFRYAKDIFDRRMEPFAYYHFVDGFVLMKGDSVTAYDAAAEKVVMGVEGDTLVRQAQAVTQSIMETIYRL